MEHIKDKPQFLPEVIGESGDKEVCILAQSWEKENYLLGL